MIVPGNDSTPSRTRAVPLPASFFCILAATLALLLPLLPGYCTAAAKAAAPQASSPSAPPLVDEYTLLEKGDNYQITIIYPGVGNSVVDTELALWARSRAGTFIRGVADIPAPPDMPHELHIYYDTVTVSDRACSVIFTSTITMGAATPESGLTTFVFDLRDGRRLSYEDIFRNTHDLLDFFSGLSRAALRERLGDRADLQLLESGTAPVSANFDLFALTPPGLTLYFPPGQAAPPREGYLRVNIPFENLASFGPYRPLWGRIETP